jgi:hypothetical protein
VIDKTSNNRIWRWLLLLACVLVFLFALHAKVGAYDYGRALTGSPSNSAKLWLNGEKIQQQSGAPGISLLWFSVLILSQLSLYRTPGAGLPFFVAIPRNLGLRDLHRTLRPPPVV